MFFGQTVSGAQPAPLNCDDSELIHISTLFIRPSAQDASKAWDVAIQGQDDSFYTVARLTKERPSTSHDLFVTAGTAVRLVSQHGKVHKDTVVDVTGYLEPLGADELSGDEQDEGSEVAVDSGSDDEEAELSDENVKKAVKATLQKLADKKLAAKDQRIEEDSADSTDSSESDSDDDKSGEESSDEDNDDSDSGKHVIHDAAMEDDDQEDDSSDDKEGDEDDSSNDEDDSEAPSNDEDSDEDSDEEEEEVPVKPVVEKKSDKKGKTEKKSVESTVQHKKRPAESHVESSSPAKKAATTPEGEYEVAVIGLLKEQGGSCKIALVGAKCRKPNGMKMKLGQFLKERSGLFSVSGDTVSLAKKN